uniref:Uncharacterized protein n=1 Tax=Romanomermis culicivorax TaxID=13658 RepID=A0A915JWH0_ROMCU
MLNCLEEKFNDPGKSAILADEYANDLKTSIKETLRKHPAQRLLLFPFFLTSACTLNPDSFDGDFFGPRGPMAGSPMLTVAAAYLRDLLFNVSSSSKNANAGLCLKKTLAESLLDEIKPCVAAKMGILDMKFPKMPVFDENLIKKQDALKTTVYRAMVHNKLHECHQDSSKKAHYSENLFNVKSNKFFRKHCDAPACLQYRNDLKRSSCTCVNELRDKWHFNFVKLRSMTQKFVDRDFCVTILNKG